MFGTLFVGVLNTANIINQVFGIIKGNFENSKSIYKNGDLELGNKKSEPRFPESKLGFDKLNVNFRLFDIFEILHALGVQEADATGD